MEDHFVNQITLSEKATMLICQREIENSMAPWYTSGPILSIWSSIGEQCRRAS
jgi:hypothetical protein